MHCIQSGNFSRKLKHLKQLTISVYDNDFEPDSTVRSGYNPKKLFPSAKKIGPSDAIRKESFPAMNSNNKWQERTVAGHPCDIFIPTQTNKQRYLVIYLHGVHMEMLRDHAEFTDQFEQHGLLVVAPVTQQSWWTDRICPNFDDQLTSEQHLLENILTFAEQQFGSKPPGIGLLGTSMGGQGALRLAYKYPDLFPVVAAISPAIDYQSRITEGDEVLTAMYSNEEEARQDTATLHIHALNWPRHQFFCCDPIDSRWYDSSDRLHMKLSALGIPHEFDLETSHGGHGFVYYNSMASRAIGFIADALERERMRVV